MLDDIEKRLTRIEASINNMIRVGTVTQVKGAKVRVKFPDADQLISAALPVLFQKTHDDQFCAMPDVGEHVVCVFLPFGLEQGFVVGAFYSSADTPPVTGSDKWHLVLKDGSWLEFDRASGNFELHAKGDVTVQADGDVAIDATGNVDITAGGTVNLEGTGTVSVNGSGQVNIVGSGGVNMDGGGGNAAGVITGASICAYTGVPHTDASTSVEASK